jgi:hypothetical protein
MFNRGAAGGTTAPLPEPEIETICNHLPVPPAGIFETGLNLNIVQTGRIPIQRPVRVTGYVTLLT